MTKQEARRLVASCIASTIDCDVDMLGAGYIYSADDGNDRSTKDTERMVEAARNLAKELHRRSKAK